MNLIYFIKRWFARRSALGNRGERLAAKYLRKQGMKILARNVRVPHGEIDIVAMENNTIVIVEVRTQSHESYKRPEDGIRSAKQKKVLHAARWYMRNRRLQQFESRIDVVAIVWPPHGTPDIRHYKNGIMAK